MPKSFFRWFSKKIFIIANIIVALLFLLGCYARWFNPASWWPVGLLTLGSFYLFIILFCFVIFWFFAKARWSAISFISYILAYGPITNMVPLRFSSKFDVDRKDSTLRVMTWNVAQFDVLRSKKDPGIKNEMGNLINHYQPDITCFQELVAGDSTPDLRSGVYKQYLFYNVDSIANSFQLPYSFYAYNYKENFMAFQHFGIAIFSRYPIINRHTVSFPPHDYNSIFQYADIVKGTDTFRVFNIHLQSMKFSNNNLKYIEDPSLKDQIDLKESKGVISKLKSGLLKRGLQAERIHAEIGKSPYPIIVCGDFNDLPNSYAYCKIGNGLQNAFEKKGSGLGHTFDNINPLIRSALRIDNIFASRQMEFLQYTCINRKLSDHFPVITDIRLSK